MLSYDQLILPVIVDNIPGVANSRWLVINVCFEDHSRRNRLILSSLEMPSGKLCKFHAKRGYLFNTVEPKGDELLLLELATEALRRKASDAVADRIIDEVIAEA